MRARHGLFASTCSLEVTRTAISGGKLKVQKTLEAVLASGRTLQFDSAIKLTMRRPNKLHAERIGDIVSQVFYYDGKTLSLTVPARSTTPR